MLDKLVKTSCKLAKSLVLFISICYSSLTLNGQTTDTSHFYSNIEKHTSSFPDSTELAIALINGDEISFVGYMIIDGKAHAIENKSSVFEIGSISKVFTAQLLSEEINQGKVKLNDRIEDYVDYPIPLAKDISFYHLANHTSGLPRLPSNLNLISADPFNPYKDYSADKLIEYLNQESTIEVGQSYAYSNLGTGLLGFILTEIDGKNFEQMLQDYIFRPLNMSSSTTSRENISRHLVRGRDVTGAVCPNWDMNVLVAAGGILSSTEDMTKFMTAQLDKANNQFDILHQATHTISERMQIGLGWHLLSNNDGSTWSWHNGGTGGYTSSLVLDRKAHKGVIILSNLSAFHPDQGNIDKLCFDLISLN